MKELLFNAEKHEYIYDGNVVPSVTHICRFYQCDTAQNADKYLRDIAADRGTRVHEATIAIDYGELDIDEVDYDIQGYCLAYQRFLQEFEVEWLKTEFPVGCETFAGTIDRYGYVNGELSILDIKTSSKINHAYVTAQLQGYEMLLNFNEIIEESIPVLLCLQLCKDGTFVLYQEKSEEFLFTEAFIMNELLNKTKGLKI